MNTSLTPPSFNAAQARLLQATVDFTRLLQPWDGFGLNYVETCQTRDYTKEPQDYGGFSTMTTEDRQRVIDLGFGPDGLRPGVIKMFLDPYHQPVEPPAEHLDDLHIDLADYDHQTTTRWMRMFVRDGLAALRDQGLDAEVIVTMYGPPAWMTTQKFVRGRDLDPTYRIAMAKYIVAWAKQLREEEDIPVTAVSLHNEGEDWIRWPLDGSTADKPGHDYNMYWPVSQVVDYVKLVRAVLDANGMDDVRVSPGETSNWLRFAQWGYAGELAADPDAVAALGLITSHGFHAGCWKEPGIAGHWAADWRSAGIDALRAQKPGLHSWVTSTSWSKMNAGFVWELMHNIYSSKNNAIIPWACIQRPSLWKEGDPNPGTAFRISDKGALTVEPGYYFYKQACIAGRPGMRICAAHTNDTCCGVIGFARGDSPHPNAIVLINAGDTDSSLTLNVRGAGNTWQATRTSPGEQCAGLGTCRLEDGALACLAPAGSVTTLVEQSQSD
jgi:hypothetical protein